MVDTLHVCRINYACIVDVIWDFSDLQTADCLLLAGLSTLAQGMLLEKNENNLKSHIKLGFNLKNSFSVLYIKLFCIFILIYSNVDMYCMCIFVCAIFIV